MTRQLILFNNNNTKREPIFSCFFLLFWKLEIGLGPFLLYVAESLKVATAHITQVSPVDVQKMSISDIGPILWMSVGEPRNIPTAETEIQGMSFFNFCPT